MLSRTHDTIGLLARSVSDIELLDSICSGDEPRRNGVALAGTRIGIPGNFYSSLDTDLAEVVTRALDVLRNSGVILVEADIRNVRELASRASVILSYEIPRELEEFLHDLAFIFVPTTLAPAALVASNPVPSASNTYLSSLAGLPCLNIPISLTHSTRLPVGMEIVGLNGDDQMILSLGRSIALALGDIQPPDPS